MLAFRVRFCLGLKKRVPWLRQQQHDDKNNQIFPCHGVQQLCGYMNPLFSFAPPENWDDCEFRFNGEVYLFIFSLPFPSFPWSNFHLPEQAGEGAGGGRQPGSVSCPFSNPGSGHHFPVLSCFSCVVSATPSFLAFSSFPLCIHSEFSESGHR